ncbi:hypothetical protein AMTRI_Chr11g152480 [Amborella trichopoda]
MSSMNTFAAAITGIFAVFFLAIVAELYYVLWWRKRFREETAVSSISGDLSSESYQSQSKELLYFLCWKNQATAAATPVNSITAAFPATSPPQPDNFQHSSASPQSESDGSLCFTPPPLPESDDFLYFPPEMDPDLLRLHSLMGYPRVLFTIKEGSREDTESEDARSRKSKSRTKSLSDAFLESAIETPFSTPCSSPPFFTPLSSPARELAGKSVRTVRHADFNPENVIWQPDSGRRSPETFREPENLRNSMGDSLRAPENVLNMPGNSITVAVNLHELPGDDSKFSFPATLGEFAGDSNRSYVAITIDADWESASGNEVLSQSSIV